MRDACRQRLVRVPGFLLPMVKNRADAYVNQLGEDRVTSKHLAELSPARFGAAGPPQLSGLDMASLRKQKKI